jgi:hypothetical protein
MLASVPGSRNRIRKPASLLFDVRRLRPRHSPTRTCEHGLEELAAEILQQLPFMRLDPPHLAAETVNRPRGLKNQEPKVLVSERENKVSLRFPGW